MSDTVNLLAFGADIIGSADTSGSASGGGHIIKDPSGDALTQQPNLQFADADVTNNANGQATVVQMIRDMDSEDFEDATEQGMYFVNDEEGYAVSGDMVAYNENKSVNDVLDELLAESESVSVTSDGVKTYGQLLNELYALVDKSKIENSYIIHSNFKFYFERIENGNELFYTSSRLSAYNTQFVGMRLKTAYSQYVFWVSNELTDSTSDVPSSGATITLYYNSSQKVVESGGTASGASFDPTIKNILPNTATDCQKAIDEVSTHVEMKQVSTGDANVYAFKFGYVATLHFGNQVTAGAGVSFLTLPNSLKPNYVVDFRDTYGNKRIQIDINGNVSCTEALSNAYIRGTVTYVTKYL